METGVPVLEPELDPLLPVETGALELVAVLDDPLVPVVTGAADAVEEAVPLVAVVTGALDATGAAADAAPVGAGAGLAPEGFACGAGLCRTLWIVLRTTWVRTFGCLVSAEVAAGGAVFELSAYPASPPSPRIVALAAILVLMVWGRAEVGLGILTGSSFTSGSRRLFATAPKEPASCG